MKQHGRLFDCLMLAPPSGDSEVDQVQRTHEHLYMDERKQRSCYKKKLHKESELILFIISINESIEDRITSKGRESRSKAFIQTNLVQPHTGSLTRLYVL